MFFEANASPNLCLVETESDFAATAYNWKGRSLLDKIYDFFVFQLSLFFQSQQHFSNDQKVRVFFSQFSLALTIPLAVDFSKLCSHKAGR
jgi:hypothetical protein